MGVKVCSLPTAVLSSHSRYEGFHFTDLTDQMKPIIEHWKQLGMAFDAVYSGFLGSPRQVSIVEEVIDTLCRDQSMVVTDPVLGDNGMLYSSVNKEMVSEMRRLVRKADIITPNLTEAALLLGEPYPEETGDNKMKPDRGLW
jgi:pyridoxine kinase